MDLRCGLQVTRLFLFLSWFLLLLFGFGVFPLLLFSVFTFPGKECEMLSLETQPADEMERGLVISVGVL